MEINLKTRLILSYTALSLLLVLSLLLISNMMLERQFNRYLVNKQEKKNLDIVRAIENGFLSGKPPGEDFLLTLGQNALGQGIILMVNDNAGNELFCMSCYDNLSCENMLNAMELTMRSRYPNFDGEYTEKVYPLTINGVDYGAVTLGYYGPFYYNDADIKFMRLLNALLIRAAFVFLIIAFGVGVFMAGRIAKPIQAVTEKTREIKRGHYNDRIGITSRTTEIASLIENVNALASTLDEQQAVKKRMARDYAHEFRTPLAAIQSNLEGIMDGVFEPTAERLESIRQEILRLSRMLTQIDRLVELENDSLILNKENFDFSDVLRQNLTTFEAELKDKNITVNVTADPCSIHADRDRISSVIINLISNAVKYTKPNGHINIEAKAVKDGFLFMVEDDGVGIDKTDLPHIFEHLYRADASRSRDSGGSGIGLSVVKAVVAAHDGHIEVESEPDMGSKFTIFIPK